MNRGDNLDTKYIIGIIVAIIIIAGAFLAFGGGNSSEDATIEIVGSTSVQPVAEKLAEEYMKSHPNVKINVQGGGSSVGIKSAQDGIADIGTSSKNLKDDEKQDLTDYMIAKDGIVVAVNKENSASDLTLDQIKGIFSGNITNWNEVGGSDGPINVITREDGSGTLDAFKEIVMGKETEIKADAIVQSSTEAVKQSVAQDPNAIGFVSFASMSDDVKALNIGGVEPTEATIADGSYEIQRPFFFITKGDAQGAVKEFIDWVLGPEGQEIVKSEKLIPAT
ncbi:MAG: phosphate ABC transporter substrate-binding protein [Euryarchaeota archaeon]|nr:phosphate ABC transporter substrate-binding protein [Euryarchaeota archaeon]MBU4607673.1 phosphate ABC transporter substrate-binding protein [Euryarchaeota archaeon]MBV1730464.1 phosphate ABC transporter substrate-binding protein [Methanobacterium sp.]MBV1755715.1 phosphate ABC transporter substrate-binding protein [Methanobacterium sp.]